MDAGRVPEDHELWQADEVALRADVIRICRIEGVAHSDTYAAFGILICG